MADPGDSPTVAEDIALLEAALGKLPPAAKKPLLVLVCGLPGSGKSYFSKRLAHGLPIALIQSDVMRKSLVSLPTYSAEESSRLFRGCRTLIQRLLNRRVAVLFDATNLREYHRRLLYRLATEAKGSAITVFLIAPEDLIKKRLGHRIQTTDEARSDADWQVYLKLRPTLEPPTGAHYRVDTSKDIASDLAKVARDVLQAMGIVEVVEREAFKLREGAPGPGCTNPPPEL